MSAFDPQEPRPVTKPVVEADPAGCGTAPAELVAGWLSTDIAAARAAYATAVHHACRHGAIAEACLGEALAADPTCAVARADLRAPVDDGHPAPATALSRWERQHIEIVSTARSGEGDRAEALLRDHVADFGCDPLALLVVAGASGTPERLDDLRDARCRCPWAVSVGKASKADPSR